MVTSFCCATWSVSLITIIRLAWYRSVQLLQKYTGFSYDAQLAYVCTTRCQWLNFLHNELYTNPFLDADCVLQFKSTKVAHSLYIYNNTLYFRSIEYDFPLASVYMCFGLLFWYNNVKIIWLDDLLRAFPRSSKCHIGFSHLSLQEKHF